MNDESPLATSQSTKSPQLGQACWLAPWLAGGALLLFRLSDVTGLHRDEATFALFAQLIQDGARPRIGPFNPYTAPVHSYIIAGFFNLFGESIWSLRLSGVLANLLAAAALIDVIRRVDPSRALCTLWVLVTMPFFVIMSRMAGENYALNPLLLFAGIWFFYVLGLCGTSTTAKRMGFLLAGFSFGLGVWNHIVFLPSLLAVAAVYVIWIRPKRSEWIVMFKFVLPGALLAATIRIYGVIVLGDPLLPHLGEHVWQRTSPIDALANAVNTLWGSRLFLRTCGEELLPLGWVLPLCLLAAAVSVKFMPAQRKRIWLAIAGVMILSLLVTWLITPATVLGFRVWLLPMWFVPVLLVLALPDRARHLWPAMVSLLVLCNLTNLGVNYFHNFLEDGGLIQTKSPTAAIQDNSKDYIDIRPVVALVADNSTAPIYIDDLNDNRLRFLLAPDQRHRAHTIFEALVANKPLQSGSLVLVFRWDGKPNPDRTMILGRVMIKRHPLCTSHFDVFEVI